MVATWTAETISGSGVRLVISQLVAVSNMAMPTLEIALAIRIAVKAALPNTPQREGADAAFEDGVDGLLTGRNPGSTAPGHPCARRASLARASGPLSAALSRARRPPPPARP